MNSMESTRLNETRASGNEDRHRLSAGKIARIIGWIMTGLVLACFFALIFGLLVKWLWGVTLTPLFHLPQPTYWQAVGLILLGKLLFGGIGHHHKEPDHSFRFPKWHDRFGGYSGKSDSSSDRNTSDIEQGKYYQDFWENEGKKAFADYLDRRRTASESHE